MQTLIQNFLRGTKRYIDLLETTIILLTLGEGAWIALLIEVLDKDSINLIVRSF